MATMWKERWYAGRPALSTAAAGAAALADNEGGVAERALGTAENTAAAISRLVEVLHEQGKLTDREVQHILDLHGYEAEM
jgi:hypothetical protein